MDPIPLFRMLAFFHSRVLARRPRARYTGNMSDQRVEELTIEECRDERFDPSAYEVVECTTYERLVIVVVREKARMASR